MERTVLWRHRETSLNSEAYKAVVVERIEIELTLNIFLWGNNPNRA